MKTAVVVEAIRTPVGNAKPDTGIFRDVRADELSAFLMKKLGGLLHWADDEGAENLVNRCEKYSDLGERFAPTELLIDMARSCKRFFPRGRIGE